ncbi:MAG: AAA-like domain-containing protein, partial [Gammaproteobacteria bacterium]|nr:AAA-like domain-containing protein [Gammaproteobacteria bacterium]
MTINKSNGKFYVVGGPVQPGRECHVLRDADATLYARLTEGEYCHVLAPSHEGKTTLMAQTAGRLRDDGVRVATIDLAQISSREIQDDVGRWYYSFAYRIVRELRIRSDMQSWWQERSGLTIMQRLREFFLEVVLHDTDEPVVIFIDGMEAALGQEFADQLLAAIRACYDTRATEPAYQRLTFALLGSVAVGQRIPRGHDSPFDISQPVKLNDFEPDEVRRLAAGLHLDSLVTEQIAEAVWDWTGGQPYLCQKIYRALARRKSASLTQQVVDQVVEALFLGPASTREEPHLSAVAKDVLRETSGYSARLSLYRRIRRGRKVLADRAMDVHRDLLRSGIVSIDEDGQFCIRNRVYSAVFTNSWVRHNQPLGWRAAAIAATLAVVFIAGPVWYTQYLPKAYRQSLSDPAEDYVSALESYRRMSFLPGFEAEADQLFADYLVSQSRRARRIAEVERLGESLTDIPGWETAGEGLRDEYWSRRTITSMRRGERDSALIYALRTLDASEAGGRNLVAELLGNDLDKLYGTVRTAKPLQALELDTVSGVIATLDDQHRVEVFHLTDSGPQRIQRLSLLAEEVVPLQRRVIVEGAGTGKRLILTAQVAHPRPADVLLELRSPSGREVALALSPNDLSDAQGIYRFDSRNDARLRTLLDENINGTWTARFSDNAQGIVGNLVDWEMSIDGKVAIAPAGYISEVSVIPEPRVARTIRSVLSPDGRRALTWPADELVRGDILVWDIGNGEVIARIPRSAGFSSASFMLGHSGVFMIAGSAVELWDIETSELRKRILIGPAFEPVLSGNGRHLIIDTVLEAGDNALSVWDMTEVVETGQLITGGVADLVAADPNGKLMAVSDGDRLVRLWSVAD